jgi:hypothetical protein
MAKYWQNNDCPNRYDDDDDNENDSSYKKNYTTPYVNHCWSCKASIDSESNRRCSRGCNMFICGSCGRCFCDKENNNDRY